MVETHLPNGIPGSWDDTLEPGELVTAWEKGYHILLRMEHREGTTPRAFYKRVVSATGKKVKDGAELSCDAAFVRRVTSADVIALYREKVALATLIRENLLEFTTQ